MSLNMIYRTFQNIFLLTWKIKSFFFQITFQVFMEKKQTINIVS